MSYLSERVGSEFLQLNAWDGNSEYMLLISKKGKVTYRCKKQAEGAAKAQEFHNRKKKYLLEEGTVIPPLVDMGVFTAEGKVVRTISFVRSIVSLRSSRTECVIIRMTT